jgi:hypothetical protein
LVLLFFFLAPIPSNRRSAAQITLRKKPGPGRRSWALVAFEHRSALERLLASPPVRDALNARIRPEIGIHPPPPGPQQSPGGVAQHLKKQQI